MSSIRFVPNERAIRQLGHLPGVIAVEEDIARQIISRAKVNSPSSEFDESLTILDRSRTPDGYKVSVGSRWSFAHLVEWGSVNNRPYAPIRKAIASLRLPFKPAGRR